MAIEHCPSCGSTEITVAGNKVHCKPCDVTYMVTAQGATVADLDPLGKDRERINKLVQDVEDLKKRGNDAGQQAEQDGEETAGEKDNDGFLKVTDGEQDDCGQPCEETG
jgi:antitoxin (DNA-binding transcriptional repressor) of toxin-antitoxin stability system